MVTLIDNFSLVLADAGLGDAAIGNMLVNAGVVFVFIGIVVGIVGFVRYCKQSENETIMKLAEIAIFVSVLVYLLMAFEDVDLFFALWEEHTYFMLYTMIPGMIGSVLLLMGILRIQRTTEVKRRDAAKTFCRNDVNTILKNMIGHVFRFALTCAFFLLSIVIAIVFKFRFIGMDDF